jgi:hypothetical protein
MMTMNKFVSQGLLSALLGIVILLAPYFAGAPKNKALILISVILLSKGIITIWDHAKFRKTLGLLIILSIFSFSYYISYTSINVALQKEFSYVLFGILIITLILYFILAKQKSQKSKKYKDINDLIKQSQKRQS